MRSFKLNCKPGQEPAYNILQGIDENKKDCSLNLKSNLFYVIVTLVVVLSDIYDFKPYQPACRN